MYNDLSVANAPKTATFQMRINPEIKDCVEKIYARCGITLTDAINIFLQQTINTEGLPLIVTQNSKDVMREQAVKILFNELNKGESSVKSDSDLISEEDILRDFGIQI